MNRRILNLSVSFFVLVLSACATLPTGPSVSVFPPQGKSFDTFRTEDATCRQWAEQQVGVSTQETYDRNVATGAVAGTAIGAGLGAAVGSASGHTGAGALIGGASGLLFGSAIGSDSGRVYGREAQRRYDNAFAQCMYSYGNQVPGYRRRVAAPRPQAPVIAPPPPPPPTDMAQADLPPLDAPPPPPEVLPAPEQYSPPPEIYVEESPQFIFSPSLNMYVAVGVPYDLMYTGSEYFYFFGGRWYRGPFYNGPWVPATRRYFPPALLRFRIENIRRYRDLEFRRYDRDRRHYNGRLHRPEFRGERRKPERREEHR
jgi:outer membrane lipoprotein SlyB